MQQISVEEIMEQIRNEIKDKGYETDILDYEEAARFDNQEAEDSKGGNSVGCLIDQMRKNAYIAWRRPISKGFKGLIKKVIRKCIGFIAAPIAEDQTAFNRASVSSVEQLYVLLEKQQIELRAQRKVIDALEKNILGMKDKI